MHVNRLESPGSYRQRLQSAHSDKNQKERPTRTPFLHGGGYKSGQLLPRRATAGRQTRIPSRRRPALPRGPATASGPAEHRSSGCKRRGGSDRASALPTSARGLAHPPPQPVPLLTGGPSPFHGSSAPHSPAATTPPHDRVSRRRLITGQLVHRVHRGQVGAHCASRHSTLRVRPPDVGGNRRVMGRQRL